MPTFSPGGKYCMYLRRSRADEDAERMGAGETLTRHQTMLQELAQRLIGHEIPGSAIYREIVSGDTVANRPEMRRLLADVERGQWDGALVADIDRLARGDTMDQGLVAQTFLYSHTLIITPMKTYDPADPADSEFFEIRLFFARREYQLIKRRMQAGRANAAREGLYPGSRNPYGYERYQLPDRRGWSLRIVPEQAAVVRMIYDWYLHGIDGEIVGCGKIASRLNDMGIRQPSGGPWEDDRVLHVLKSPIYAGYVTWDTRVQKIEMIDGQKTKKRVRGDNPIRVKGVHPPIVSEADFAAAQNRIVSRRVAPVPTNRTTSNALSGLLRCGVCGRAMHYMSPSTRPEKWARLKCSNPNPCGNRSAAYRIVLAAVLDTLRDWATYDQDKLPTPAEDPDPSADLRAAQEKQLSTLQHQLSRLRDLLEQGVYDVDTYLSRQRDIRERMDACASAIAQLQPPPKSRAETLAELAPAVRNVLDAYSTAGTPGEQNALLKSVMSRIVFYKRDNVAPGQSPADAITLEIFPLLPSE